MTVQPRAEVSDNELAALDALNTAVYPPDVVANWPGRGLEWSPKEWTVIVWSDDRSLALAHAGIVIRAARHNERDVNIGGIGSLMTHPDYRRQGAARSAIGRCLEFFRKRGDIDFGLLVCTPTLVPLYERLGWRAFPGEMFVTQHGEQAKFTFNLPMTIGVNLPGDLSGVIDLLGPPW